MTIKKKKICETCKNEVDTLYQNPEFITASVPMCLDCILRLTNMIICPRCYSIIHKDNISESGIYIVKGQAMCRQCLISSLQEEWQ